jgi:hypothetical protein
MAWSATQITVAATETALLAAQTSRTRLTVRNTHATDALFIGLTGVTIGTGYSLPAGTSDTFLIPSNVAVFGIRNANAIVASVSVTT